MITTYVKTAQIVGKQKMSEIVPFLEIVSAPYNLELKKLEDYKIAKRLLIRAICYN